MMGAEQLSWFLNEIKESSEKYPLVIWVSSVPYTAEKKEGEDDWGGFTYERRVIANFIKKNDINNLMIVSGDAHSVLHNQGLENNYSDYEGDGLFEVLASPLDNWATSVKGGPWTQVYRPKKGELVYGLLEVDYSNNKTTVYFKSFDTNHQVVIQAEKSFKTDNKKD
jgi:phosphodiesterase/alkaline phosphatase D-like protein